MPDNTSTKTVDARGADWRGLQIGSRDLSQAKLCRTDLRGADLSQCVMNEADLRMAKYDNNTKCPEEFDIRSSGAIGPGAKLNGAFFNCTDLRGMDLRGAILMGSYLSGADLSGSILDGVRLAGSDLRCTLLRGTSCKQTRFGGCQLDYADFRGADLSEADITGVESIKGANFSLTTGINTSDHAALLSRPYEELDCWNALTRQTTRTSLEEGMTAKE